MLKHFTEEEMLAGSKEGPLAWGHAPTWHNHAVFYFLNVSHLQLR